jgi:hypothetical protein
MATITEDYVSFETAKLLKEKGFNERCKAFRSPSGKLFYSSNYIKNFEEKKTIGGAVTAPTLAVAMKWLREEHNIFISIIYEKYDEVFIADVKSPVSGIDCWVDNKHNCWFKYEEAAEEAIKFCLKNLI